MARTNGSFSVGNGITWIGFGGGGGGGGGGASPCPNPPGLNPDSHKKSEV